MPLRPPPYGGEGLQRHLMNLMPFLMPLWSVVVRCSFIIFIFFIFFDAVVFPEPIFPCDNQFSIAETPQRASDVRFVRL